MKRWMRMTTGVALLFSLEGCAVEAESVDFEEEIRSEDQAFLNGNHYVIYAFNAGNWRRSDYAWPATTNPTVTTGSFGASDDLPFIWEPTSNAALAKIGTYGKSGNRLGYFYFDDSGNMQWGAGDGAGIKFRSDAQSGDKPFVVTAQLWGRNSNGQCVARVSGGSAVTGRMVGIKRGSTVYLDRDGNGVWGGANHCDLSGTIGLSNDNPAGITSPSSTSGGHILALTRKTGNDVNWFYDNNLDLNWFEPPDWTSPVNAFGDGYQYPDFPFTHPDCIATKWGTTVFYDINCNGIWQSGDSTYTSAFPSSAWKLAGVDSYFQHP